MSSKSWIALTPGEPAGVGPELTVKLARQVLPAPVLAVCDPAMLERAARQTELPLHIELIPADGELPAAAVHQPGQIYCRAIELNRRECLGSPHADNAEYVLRTLREAATLCHARTCQALVTAPVHKGVINQAGIPFTGHTEYLAGLFGNRDVLMMLTDGRIRVALCTTHLALNQVPARITKERIINRLSQLAHGLRTQFGIVQPRITVLGLNPHAGEGGHLGVEELEIIQPAMMAAAVHGMHLRGPVPADTAFTPASLRQCDAILAMYHDQGLPPLKALGFGRVVNVTLGLPIIRTSVDHGTALDIAGKNKADVTSLRTAYDLALEMVR